MFDNNILYLQLLIESAIKDSDEAEKELKHLHVVRCHSLKILSSEHDTIIRAYADFIDDTEQNDIDDFTATIYFRITRYTQHHTIHCYTSRGHEYEAESQGYIIEYMNMFDMH